MVEIWRLYKELNANKMDISPNFTYWKMTLVLFNPIFFFFMELQTTHPLAYLLVGFLKMEQRILNSDTLFMKSLCSQTPLDCEFLQRPASPFLYP